MDWLSFIIGLSIGQAVFFILFFFYLKRKEPMECKICHCTPCQCGLCEDTDLFNKQGYSSPKAESKRYEYIVCEKCGQPATTVQVLVHSASALSGGSYEIRQCLCSSCEPDTENPNDDYKSSLGDEDKKDQDNYYYPRR